MEVIVNSLPQVLLAMQNCYQFEGVNMYDHGLMVNKEYFNIISSLELGFIDEVFPEELYEIYRNNVLIPFTVMLQYQTLHDCGKPFCREVDQLGRTRYPDHAVVSHSIIRELFPTEIDLQYLVLHDMDFHTLKPKDLVEVANSKYGFSLYLTAWSELIANSQMFGGYDSVSFKIKRKHLIKCLRLFRHD